MANDDDQLRKATFKARADGYDSESEWVTGSKLLLPLVDHNLGNDPGCLLDVCAGTCVVSLQALTRGWCAVALDESARMLSQVKNSTVSKVVGDALHLPFVSNSFSIVAMRQALHYLDLHPAIEELFRVSKGEIRLGHITLHHEDDRNVWASYFELASPGRKHIFAPGEVPAAIRSVGGIVSNEQVLIVQDCFEGPILHLGSESVGKLRRLFLTAPKSFQHRNLQFMDQSTFKLNLRWEFVSAKKSRDS